MSKLLFVLLTLATGCTTMASAVRPSQRRIPPDAGIVLGRIGFVARKAMAIQKLQLAARAVPGGDLYWIDASTSGEADRAGSFFVNLPPGHYRLTQWTARAGDREWAGQDVGLSIEVMRGQVVCVGALYVQPRERQILQLDASDEPPAVVRDECDALNDLLRAHAPALSQSALIKVAQPVGRRRS